MNKDQMNAALPLSPKVFHILIALAAEPMNGYRLGQRVEEGTGGTIRMSPATLYENIHRLAERGIIQEVEGDLGEKTDGRGQRFYTLTDVGLEVLKAEVARLAADVSLAQSLLALGA